MSQSAADILKAAVGHMEDRAATYDKPEGERSMPATVAAFNALTGHQITAEQGWLFMVLLKLCRTQQGGFRADNYEDGSAYFALMGEQAAGDRREAAKPQYPTWATHMLESLGSTWYVRACGPKGWEALDEAGKDAVAYFNQDNIVAGSIKALPKNGPVQHSNGGIKPGMKAPVDLAAEPIDPNRSKGYGPCDEDGWRYWSGKLAIPLGEVEVRNRAGSTLSGRGEDFDWGLSDQVVSMYDIVEWRWKPDSQTVTVTVTP